MVVLCRKAPCSPVIVNDKSDSLEKDGILSIGVLHLLGFGRFLGFVKNRLQTLNKTAFNSAILRRRVALQETQQLTGQPGSRDKVICVVLQVSGRRGHDLINRERCFRSHTAIACARVCVSVCVHCRKKTYPAETGHGQGDARLELVWVFLAETGDQGDGCSDHTLERNGLCINSRHHQRK